MLHNSKLWLLLCTEALASTPVTMPGGTGQRLSFLIHTDFMIELCTDVHEYMCKVLVSSAK